MKKKLVGAGSAIALSILASAIYDFIRDRQLFSTIVSIFTTIWNAILSFLQFEVRIWWVLLCGLLLAAFFYKSIRTKGKEKSAIVGLQKKLTIAESEIALLSDDSDIAFDDCVFDFRYNYPIDNSCYSSKSISLKLPALFEVIAIALEDAALPELLITQAVEKQLLGGKCHFADKQAIKRVIIQLQALKLISSNLYKGKDGNLRSYWSLTPKGRKARNDMVLIKTNAIVGGAGDGVYQNKTI